MADPTNVRHTDPTTSAVLCGGSATRRVAHLLDDVRDGGVVGRHATEEPDVPRGLLQRTVVQVVRIRKTGGRKGVEKHK